MDECEMNALSGLPSHIALPIGFVAGLLLGHGYFRALRVTTALIVAQGHPLLGLALTVGRLAMLVAGFYVAVQVSGYALLAALAGVVCAKARMLSRLRRECP